MSWKELITELDGEEAAAQAFIAEAMEEGAKEEVEEMRDILNQIGGLRETWMGKVGKALKEQMPEAMEVFILRRSIESLVQKYTYRGMGYYSEYSALDKQLGPNNSELSYIPVRAVEQPDIVEGVKSILLKLQGITDENERKKCIQSARAKGPYKSKSFLDIANEIVEELGDQSRMDEMIELFELMPSDSFVESDYTRQEFFDAFFAYNVEKCPNLLNAPTDPNLSLSQKAGDARVLMLEKGKAAVLTDYLIDTFEAKNINFLATCLGRWASSLSATEDPRVSANYARVLQIISERGKPSGVKNILVGLIDPYRPREAPSRLKGLQASINPELRKRLFPLLWEEEAFEGYGPFLWGDHMSTLFEAELEAMPPETWEKHFEKIADGVIETDYNREYPFLLLRKLKLPPEKQQKLKMRLLQAGDCAYQDNIGAEQPKSKYGAFVSSAISSDPEFFDSIVVEFFNVGEIGPEVEAENRRSAIVQKLIAQKKADEVLLLLQGGFTGRENGGRRWLNHFNARDCFRFLLTLPRHVPNLIKGRMCQYLMSVVPPEEIPEVERACLDASLPPTDFCHVILTSGTQLFTSLDTLSVTDEQRLLQSLIQVGSETSWNAYLEKRKASHDPVGSSPEARAVAEYAKYGLSLDGSTVQMYIAEYLTKGAEAAQVFVERLKEKSKLIIGEAAPVALRNDPGYTTMVKTVFPSGNYSTHEKNLACGDATQHLEQYRYDHVGYPVELSGLMGYQLRTEVDERTGRAIKLEDDARLYRRYENRFWNIQRLISGRSPDNKEGLQKDFDSIVESYFTRFASSEFASLEDLTIKEKMLALFVSEAVRKDKDPDFVPNEEVLDLIVSYKYAYHENLEAYVQRSASDAKQYKDETSQRFVQWQELSTIYGENLKHVLRHNIFEDLSENGKSYAKIVEAFGSAVAMSSEGFELSPREVQQFEVLCKKKMSEEELYQAVLDKVTELFGPQDKSKKDPEKKALYEAERMAFVAQIDGHLAGLKGNLTPAVIREVIEAAFPMQPRQLKRLENTFDNEQIPREDRWIERTNKNGVTERKFQEGKFNVLLKQCVDMFGSNISFKDEDEEQLFRDGVAGILEPIKETLDKQTFVSLVPKLRTLRNQFRFRINAKLEELFANDVNAINREIAKFEELTEVEAKETRMGGAKEKVVKKSAKKRHIRSFVSKTQETANARMGAYLCIAGDQEMWKNPNYFEIVDKDEDTGKCVGVTMLLNIEAQDGKRYLWMGPNPFESFLTQVSAEKAFEHQYETVVRFAEQNGFDGVVVPSEDGQILGACTNRGGTFPDLIKAKRLRDKKGGLRIVDYGKEHKLGLSYGYSKGALMWERGSSTTNRGELVAQ